MEVRLTGKVRRSRFRYWHWTWHPDFIIRTFYFRLEEVQGTMSTMNAFKPYIPLYRIIPRKSHNSIQMYQETMLTIGKDGKELMPIFPVIGS